MKSARLPLGLLVSFAVALAACGEGGGTRPSVAAPQDVIAFGAREAGGAGRYGLYLVRPDGSGLRKLVEEAGEVAFPLWSPPGDRIVYLVRADLQTPATLKVYDFQNGLASTVSQNALADILGPTMSWSPDGRRLAFVDATAGGRLSIYDVDKAQLLDLPDVPARTVDWSPSKDELALAGPAQGVQETDLYLVDDDGDNLRPLLERPGLESGPRWSPNGELLAFWSAPPGRPDRRLLLVLPADSEQPIELTPGFGAAWTADSGRLAYSGPASEAEPDDLDIFLLPAGGGDPQPLGQSITRDRWPTWSPANDQVAYHAQADLETAFICIVQLEPENRDCLDLGSLLPGAPAWSPQ